MCQLEKYETISGLRKKIVVCAKGNKVGTIIDVVFSDQLKIHSFIIGGTIWEEIREAMGIIDDIDPVIPVETIKEVNDNSILLNVAKQELKHKLQEGALPAKAYFYSALKRLRVFDKNNKKFGRIVNLLFAPCGEPAFIIGGTAFEEITESLGFKEDIDLLLPINNITKIDSERIQIDIIKEKLKLAIDEKPLDYADQKSYLDSLKAKGEMESKFLIRPHVEQTLDATRFQ